MTPASPPTSPSPSSTGLLGIRTAEQGGVTVTSSSYLRGILASARFVGHRRRPEHRVAARLRRGVAARGLGPGRSCRRRSTVDHLDLVLDTDGDHSVPTELRIEGGGQTRTVGRPAPDRPAHQTGATTPVTVRFAPLTASQPSRWSVTDVRRVTNNDYYSEQPIVRPIGVAELGIPGVEPGPGAGQLLRRLPNRPPRGRRPAGRVRITGSTETPAARSPLHLQLCGDAVALTLGRGDHVLRATKGKRSGIDLDRLALSSAGASAAGRRAPDRRTHPRGEGHPRRPHVTRPPGAEGDEALLAGARTELEPRLDGQGRRWRVARPATLVDGYANGWYVDPKGRTDLQVSVDWTPQRTSGRRSRCPPRSSPSAWSSPCGDGAGAPAPSRSPSRARAPGPPCPSCPSPLSYERSPDWPSRRHAVTLSVGCGLLAARSSRHWWGRWCWPPWPWPCDGGGAVRRAS